MSALITLAPGMKNPMTTGGDIIYGGASGTPSRLANGSAGQFLKSNGTTLAPSWGAVTASPAFNYTAQTAPYTATINDWVTVSGTSGTVTLPTAVGVSGQMIVAQHGGTSLTSTYVYNTTGGQSFITPTGTIASGAYVHYTATETTCFASDNANWRVLWHYAQTSPATYTPTQSGWTLGASPYVTWMRDGRFQIITAFVTVNSPAATEFRFGTAGSLAIDSSITQTTLFALGMKNTNSGPQSILGNGGNAYLGYAEASSPAGGLVPANANSGFSSGQNLGFTVRIPIAGWQP